ncbi:MAG: hypothetical protein HOP12_03855, partial [Candidatus Eisenbacteria bacterium]|nr:hypothetical protein [Candidatus Eisenbacteria bacterium]
MRPHSPRMCGLLLAACLALPAVALHAAPLAVTQLSPARNAVAQPTAAVVIDFDKPVNPASVTPSTFRVFGRASGTKTGAFTFSNGNQRVSFQPSEPFSAGETVRINLSHDLAAADLTTLRSAGYFYQFQIRTLPGGTFQSLGSITNRINNVQTRIYGAAATDLNNDGWIDLATINEVSSDVRVCLSRADGSGLYQPFLPAQPIGFESSPNDPADFNNDGNTDLCIDASYVSTTAVMLGAGNGTFSSIQNLSAGDTPHGITTLDVDGDGDPDIATANQGDDNLGLLINNGAGVFSPPTFFEGGVNGEYGLVAADMNNDGIADLVVAGNGSGDVRVMRGNGDGTFTQAGPARSCGGLVWVVVVDDVDGDGNLDAATANNGSGNGAILLGNGDGTFDAATLYSTGSHTPSVDLGDLDGDGDPDLVLSVYSGGIWRYFLNDGAGNFAFQQDFTAPSNPSCAVLYDSDNDGDLDMALTDEIADVIVLMRNIGAADVAPGALPAQLALRPNAPNPFRDGTVVRFALPAPAQVRLDVFDVSGRRVASMEPVARGAGWQELAFNGRDAAGAPLATGVYSYRVSAGA